MSAKNLIEASTNGMLDTKRAVLALEQGIKELLDAVSYCYSAEKISAGDEIKEYVDYLTIIKRKLKLQP